MFWPEGRFFTVASAQHSRFENDFVLRKKPEIERKREKRKQTLREQNVERIGVSILLCNLVTPSFGNWLPVSRTSGWKHDMRRLFPC